VTIKRSRPKIDRQVPTKVAKAESKNDPTDRKPAVPHEQGGQRPRCAWRSFTTIDDDWARRDRQRGRLKDVLSTDQEILEAMEQTQPQNPEAVTEPNYEPTDYERAVLAKQAERF
jgi:hypothetical protein